MNNVQAVVLNWLTARRTLGAINSIKKFLPDLPITIVDDGSDEKDLENFIVVYKPRDENRELVYNPNEIYDPDTSKLKNIPGTTFIQVPTHRRHGEALDYALPRIKAKWIFHLDSDARLRKDGALAEMMEGITDENCSIGFRRLHHGLVYPEYPQISSCICMFRNDLYKKYKLKMKPIYEKRFGPMTAYHHFLTKKGYKIKYLPDDFRQYYVHLRWSGKKGKDEWNRYF